MASRSILVINKRNLIQSHNIKMGPEEFIPKVLQLINNLLKMTIDPNQETVEEIIRLADENFNDELLKIRKNKLNLDSVDEVIKLGDDHYNEVLLNIRKNNLNLNLPKIKFY